MPGRLTLPTALVDADGRQWNPARPWSGSAADMAANGLALGLDRLVRAPAKKACWARQTGACIVDMESHRVARVAKAAGLSLFIVRAISDPSSRRLPALAETAIRGHVDRELRDAAAGRTRSARRSVYGGRTSWQCAG